MPDWLLEMPDWLLEVNDDFVRILDLELSGSGQMRGCMVLGSNHCSDLVKFDLGGMFGCGQMLD
jgi:hypothetical protein